MAEIAPDPLPKPRPLWLRLLPLGVVLAVLAGAWAGGVFNLFSLDALRDNRLALAAYVADHRALALLAFMGIYTLATVCAMPGAMWLTISAGFLFGLATAASAVVVSATIGAVILFLVARTAFGESFTRRAGPFLRRMEKGFRQDEAFYMLAIRLVPAVPYPVANVAPALLGARLSTFAWTTFIGIIPGVLAYAWIGAGLGGVLDVGKEPDIAAIGKQILPALIALGLLPILAIIVRRIGAARRKNAA